MNSVRAVLLYASAIALCLAPFVYAHEGHDHKVMGTVAKIQDNEIDVKGQDGKTVTVTLNDQTKILRGKQKAGKAEIKEGERVVVIYTTTKEKVSVAKEVRLAPTATTN
jgi:hypothetical protein